jgi:hypothetical protein
MSEHTVSGMHQDTVELREHEGRLCYDCHRRRTDPKEYLCEVCLRGLIVAEERYRARAPRAHELAQQLAVALDTELDPQKRHVIEDHQLLADSCLRARRDLRAEDVSVIRAGLRDKGVQLA